MAADCDIPALIRRHRQTARLSRVELGLLAGVGKTAIYDLEHGKLSIRFDTLLKILAALNIGLRFESPLLAEELAP